MINPIGGYTVDLDRLERGVQLVAERAGLRRFRVTGGTSEHSRVIAAIGPMVARLRRHHARQARGGGLNVRREHSPLDSAPGDT
ncbi:MAG TPA: hypothetical protein VG432_01325 [Gemmatimonadaceae bacterium]|nr:hypothetical protein [Gemmatimonadaceae bacterium]